MSEREKRDRKSPECVHHATRKLTKSSRNLMVTDAADVPTARMAAPVRTVGNTTPTIPISRQPVRYVAANQAQINQRPRGQPPMQEEREVL